MVPFDPRQMAMNLISHNPNIANNPNAQEFINVIQNGDSARGQQIADNLAQSQANQNNYLIGQLRPSPIPAYTVANPYAGFGYGCCGTAQTCCC